ncbi:hypothetical protein IF2G_04831 [Cordyceps javanica]|nr:hypothetical protein IF2G_04831 [Cordyceps javanica]
MQCVLVSLPLTSYFPNANTSSRTNNPAPNLDARQPPDPIRTTKLPHGICPPPSRMLPPVPKRTNSLPNLPAVHPHRPRIGSCLNHPPPPILTPPAACDASRPETRTRIKDITYYILMCNWYTSLPSLRAFRRRVCQVGNLQPATNAHRSRFLEQSIHCEVLGRSHAMLLS